MNVLDFMNIKNKPSLSQKKRIIKKRYNIFFYYLKHKKIKYHIKNGIVIVREDLIIKDEVILKVLLDYNLYYKLALPDNLIIKGNFNIFEIIYCVINLGEKLTIEGNVIFDNMTINLEKNKEIIIKKGSFSLVGYLSNTTEKGKYKHRHISMDLEYLKTETEMKIINVDHRFIEDSNKLIENKNIHLISKLDNIYIDIKYDYKKKMLDLADIYSINTLNYLSPSRLHFKLLMNNNDCIEYLEYKKNNKHYSDEINEDDINYFLANREQLSENKEYDLNNIIFYCHDKQAFNFLYKNGYKFSQEELEQIPKTLNNIINLYEMYLLKYLSKIMN